MDNQLLRHILWGDVASVRRLLEEHPTMNLDIDLRYVGGDEYTTPLAAAAYVGSAEIIQLLLEYGADPDFTTRDNDTPLVIGIRESRAEAVRALLEGGADPDADDALLSAA